MRLVASAADESVPKYTTFSHEQVATWVLMLSQELGLFDQLKFSLPLQPLHKYVAKIQKKLEKVHTTI